MVRLQAAFNLGPKNMPREEDRRQHEEHVRYRHANGLPELNPNAFKHNAFYKAHYKRMKKLEPAVCVEINKEAVMAAVEQMSKLMIKDGVVIPRNRTIATQTDPCDPLTGLVDHDYPEKVGEFPDAELGPPYIPPPPPARNSPPFLPMPNASTARFFVGLGISHVRPNEEED